MLNPSWGRLEGLQWTCFHRKLDNANATCWFISLPSWELRYPFPKHIWKWCSFFEKLWYVSFLEGTPSENILQLGNCTNNCWSLVLSKRPDLNHKKPCWIKPTSQFAMLLLLHLSPRNSKIRTNLNFPQLPWKHTTHIYHLPFWKCQRNQSSSTASAACR